MTHDPLCQFWTGQERFICQCPLIAKVREDQDRRTENRLIDEWIKAVGGGWNVIPPGPKCGCSMCWDQWEGQQVGFVWSSRGMVVCPECGNKRCPKATFHENECTGSNEPNQPGSRYNFTGTEIANMASDAEFQRMFKERKEKP